MWRFGVTLRMPEEEGLLILLDDKKRKKFLFL
jgi:hypothetical protein